jgi:outer membrane protein assembly factor BamB
MKMHFGAVATVLLALTTAQAQSVRVYTRPTTPPREALDRLNLQVGWQTVLPTDGTRDGVFSFQMAGKQVLVQTRSGLVVALDRDSGATLWRARIGKPYESLQPLGWNAKSVFAAHGSWLFALDRNTGQVQWQYPLPDAVAAAPVADDQQIYLSLTAGQASVYLLPPESRRETLPAASSKNFLPQTLEAPARPSALHKSSSGTTTGAVGPLSSAIQASRNVATGPRPIFLRDFRAGTGLEVGALLTPFEVLWTGAGGSVMVLPRTPDIPLRPYRFPTEGPISVQPGQWGETAYVASHDGNLYALDIPTGRLLWRFTGGNPIKQKPIVTNDDVYIAPQGSGLHRLDRATGQEYWHNAAAVRFLAANPKFVYAADRSNRLLVLDRARGTQLSAYDGTRDFNVPLANEQTDRLFLAGENGLLLCLHDRGYEAPVRMKDEEEKQFPAAEKRPGLTPRESPDEKIPDKPEDKMPDKKGRPDGKAPGRPEGKMEKP